MSKPSSTNARASDAAGGIRVALADGFLAAAVRDALDDHLSIAGELVISDGDDGVVIAAGGYHGDISSRDPAVIAAAALLVAAGYALTPRVEPVINAIHLSQREQQVGALLLEGASNKLIARRLGISVHTAKFHVTGVLDKLGA